MIAAMTAWASIRCGPSPRRWAAASAASSTSTREEYVCCRTVEEARQADEVDRGPLRGLRRHHPRPRHHRLHRRRGEERRQGARPQDAADRRHRRLQHAADRGDPDAHDADGQRHLRHPGDPHDAHRGVHQQDADRRLPRRRPTGGDVLRRARDGHARAPSWGWIRPTCAARTSSRPSQFPFTTPDGCGLRLGRLREVARPGAEGRTGKALEGGARRAHGEGRLVGLGLSFYVEVCGLGPSASLPTGGWEHCERHGRARRDRSRQRPAPRRTGRARRRRSPRCSPISSAMPIERRHDPARRHRHREAGHRHLRQPLARRSAARRCMLRRRQGQGQDGAVRRAPAREPTPDDIVFEDGRSFVKGAPGDGDARSPQIVDAAYVPVPLPDGHRARALGDAGLLRAFEQHLPLRRHISCSRSIATPANRSCSNATSPSTTAARVINPLIVEGQIHGGIAQGIGQAMIEEAVYDEDGQLITGSFMDYAIPRATDFPRLRARQAR